jgi:hypothetical protein
VEDIFHRLMGSQKEDWISFDNELAKRKKDEIDGGLIDKKLNCLRKWIKL